MPAFYLGVKEGLEKKSFDVSSMPVNENILPSLSSQAKWKYVRTKDGLKLSDGNLVYSFGGFPENYPSEDTRISRLTDDNILNFEKDHVSKGTAQIHRSSPDNIYMTLADGSKNPTFMLQHETGQNWRYSPSKKFLEKLKAVQTASNSKDSDQTLVDPESLMMGGIDSVKQASDATHQLINSIKETLPSNIVDSAVESPYIPAGFIDATSLAEKIQNTGTAVKDAVKHHMQFAAENPAISMLGTYGVGRGIDAVKDYINPSRKIDRMNETDEQKRSRQFSNISIAALPTLASMSIMK
jgi:hypothetical protein